MEDKDIMIYLVVVMAFSFFIFLTPAFAQSVNSTQYGFQSDQTSGEPILEQVSEKGIYRVLFRWADPVGEPQGEIAVEIVFLNASAAEPTSDNIPQTETNNTGASTPDASGFNVPGSIESTLPVESYDIAIYASNGSELFKMIDQPGFGGRGAQSIEFEGNYTGPITIEISDIKPGWNTDGTAEAELTDSVTFATAVVPEFPTFLIGLVMASTVGALIAVARIKRQI